MSIFSFATRKSELPTADTALKGRPAAIPTATTHFVNHHPLKGPYPAGMETASILQELQMTSW